MKKLLLFCVAVFALAAGANRAMAVTYNWTGATNSNWSNNANWGGAGHPMAGDVAQIGVVAYPGGFNPAVDVSSACTTLTIGSLTAVTLTISNALAVSGTITVGSGSVVNINAALSSGAITVNSGSTVTSNSSGTITSTSSMDVTASTLSLAAAVSLTTDLTIHNGNATLNSTSTIAAKTMVTNTGTLTLGAALNISTGITVNSTTINGSAAATITSGSIDVTTASLTLAAPVTLSLDLTIHNGNTTLNSTSTIAAKTMVTGTGTLTLGAALNISTGITVISTTINGSAAATITSGSIDVTTASLTLAAPVTLSLDLTIHNGNTTLNSTSTIAAKTMVTGTGTLTLGAALNISTGITVISTTINGSAAATITSGSIDVTTGSLTLAALVNLSADLTIHSGTSTLTTSVAGNTFGTLVLLGMGILNFNGSGSTNVSGVVTMGSVSNLNVGAGNTIAAGSIDMAPGTGAATALLTTLTNGGTIKCTGAVSMPNYTNIVNSAGGIFTINNAAAVALSGTDANIANAGTFYAGTSGSACTLKLSTATSNITNTGTFYLGSTSVINVTVIGASVSNSGTFTIQSDVNGSGTIGTITGVAPFSGTYNAERYLSGGSPAYRSYRSLSSPVYETSETSGSNTYNVYSINYVALTAPTTGSGGVAGGFTQAGNPTFYLYRDNIAPSNSSFTGGNFRGIASLSGDPTYSINGGDPSTYIPAGNGFLFFDRGNKTGSKFVPGTSAESITLTATGKLNTGSITVTPWFTLSTNTLDYTAVAGNASVLGFALVGNPYPSSIDWDQWGTGITETSVGKTMYILNPLNLNYETYIAGTPGQVGTYSNYANIIPSGQGFFVQATAAGAKLTFTEAAKTNTQVSVAHSNLFLGKPPQAAVGQYFRLKLWQDSIHNDAILINFNRGAKPQYVFNEDARYRPGNGAVSLSSLSADNVPLAINTLPLPKQTPVIIPLNVNAKTDGAYQLTLPAVKNIPQLYDIWLMDAYKKDSLDLRHNPTYTFGLVKSDTNSYGSKRFTLVIRQNPALIVHLLNFTAQRDARDARVTWTTENEQNYTNFTVERSTDGGLTFSELGGVPAAAQGVYSFADKATANGANKYRLKIEDLNGVITYSNVVTVQYSNTGNTLVGDRIIIYPNPVKGPLNLTIPQGPNSPAVPVSANTGYNIKIVNNLGSVVQNKTTNTQNWQTDVSSLTPGTYILLVTKNSDKSLVGKGTFVKL